MAALHRSDSNTSFNVAAKHLFRHLHEPRVLRRNPLVRHFFESPAIDGLGPVRERAVLDRIHNLVRQGAEHCRGADLMAGRDEHALRQYAIVTLQCLEQRPIREIAAALGISYQYCYRERAKICRRIARYICECGDAVAPDYLPELDEFQILMDRTMHRAAFAEMSAAFRECDDLICVAPSAQQKIEALRTSAFISIGFGNIKRARDAYAAAQVLCAEDLGAEPSLSWSVAQACIDLIGSKLAYYRADAAEALPMAQRATFRLEAVQESAAAHVRELYVESLYELGLAFCNLGNMDRGYDCIAGAEANLRYVRAASSRLRTRVMGAVWKLRNHLLMSSKSWAPLWQRLKGLESTFEQAYASGSLVEAATALVTLAEHHALAGNDVEALHEARLAVSLAKQQPSERMQSLTSVRVAILLLSTRYSEYALSLLPSSQQLESCEAYVRELAMYFAAERAFRLHNFRDAWTWAKGEGDRREYAPLAPLTVSRHLIAAAAAHELEQWRDARALIEETIPAAEQLGSAPTLRDVYRVAAKVTGDIRFKRQASEVARLLTA
jgi:hypothetical protein